MDLVRSIVGSDPPRQDLSRYTEADWGPILEIFRTDPAVGAVLEIEVQEESGIFRLAGVAERDGDPIPQDVLETIWEHEEAILARLDRYRKLYPGFWSWVATGSESIYMPEENANDDSSTWHWHKRKEGKNG